MSWTDIVSLIGGFVCTGIILINLAICIRLTQEFVKGRRNK